MSYVIIGAATQVDFNGNCVISAQWGYSANPTRLYCIGSWTPSDTYYKPSESLSVTIYAPGPTYTTTPSQNCNDVNTISAGVTPASCDTLSLTEFSGSWLVQSYSYTKQDRALPGQETWSLVRWKNLSTSGPTNSIEPTYVLRTISEGQSSGNSGIEFDSGSETYEASTGSVSANSMGTADTLTYGIVSQVGGGSSTQGDTGQGSASIPYTPLYI